MGCQRVPECGPSGVRQLVLGEGGPNQLGNTTDCQGGQAGAGGAEGNMVYPFQQVSRAGSAWEGGIDLPLGWDSGAPPDSCLCSPEVAACLRPRLGVHRCLKKEM